VSGVLYPDFPSGNVDESLTKTYAIFGAQRRLRFNPAEINRQGEEILTGYVSAKLGTEILGLPVDGAAGLRLIQTKTASSG
jgi:iron complex outermembrane receptor protein